MQDEPSRAMVWRKALEIAVPLMLAESVDSVLWIVDAYFVGKLGDKALAAVALGGYLGWMMFTLGSMFYMGALVLVSQAVGAGRKDIAKRVAGEALTANLLIAIPLALVAYAASPHLIGILAGGGVTIETQALAVDYFRARLVGLPFAYAGLVLGAVYRGFGVTRPVFTSTIVFAVFNAVLDPILIFGLLGAPALGVAGAGYASSVANMVLAVMLSVLTPRSLGILIAPAIPGAWAVKAARVGAPPLLERIAVVSAHLAYLSVVARCGDVALAAHSIGVRVESLAFLPLFSMGEASASLVGQHIGAGDFKGGERTGWLVSQLSLILGLTVAVILVAASGIVPQVFTDDPTVEGLARVYLIMAALTEPFYAVSETLLMSIRGAGNTLIPTLVNTGSLYALRVPGAMLLPRILGPSLCAIGAWLAMVIDVIGRSVIAVMVYRRLFKRLVRRLL